ncbi:MAG: methyltransferase domain-containing protein [Clostridiales bacterium]|nr:methyltransferase domain-containing protein [Clostridiales bacterium]
MNIFFDQYQRYKNVELIVNDFRKNGETFKILEVGANEHKNLEKFLFNDNIFYLETHLSEKLKKDPAYILGDATQMHFEDNEFDIVVALDVFEHIPKERRELFLREIDRVSSNLFIIAGPFYSDSVSEAELRVNAQYKCIFGKNHPWLIEHIENQLPKLEQSISILETMGRKISRFGHGDLRLWERLTNIQVVADINEDFRAYSELIYDFYNKYLFPLDYSKEVYRTFLIGMNEEKEFKPNISTCNSRVLEKFNDIERSFWNIVTSFGTNSFRLKEDNSVFVFKCYYIEEGYSNFSEEQCHIVDFSPKSNEYSVDFEKKKIVAVRIDPLDCNCVIDNFNVVSENMELNIVSTNGLNIGANKYIFSSNDPNIFIEVPQVGVTSIQVHFDVLIYNNTFIKEIYDLLFDKDNEIEELHKGNEKNMLEMKEQLVEKNNKIEYQKRLSLEKQKELDYSYQKQLKQFSDDLELKEMQLKMELKFEKESKKQMEEEMKLLINEINQIHNSKSWKITKPVRTLGKIRKKL